MSLVDEYRGRALVCVQAAANADEPTEKSAFATMAQLWLRLAEFAAAVGLTPVEVEFPSISQSDARFSISSVIVLTQ